MGGGANNRDGGSSPVASILTGVAAIRALHRSGPWAWSNHRGDFSRALLENQLQEVQHQAIHKSFWSPEPSAMQRFGQIWSLGHLQSELSMNSLSTRS